MTVLYFLKNFGNFFYLILNCSLLQSCSINCPNESSGQNEGAAVISFSLSKVGDFSKDRLKKENSIKMELIRSATHAGSWYPSSPELLKLQIIKYFKSVFNGQTHFKDSIEHESLIRMIVSPHAGYSYSGPTAAYAYAQLLNRSQTNPNADIFKARSDIKRIFIIGPSHYRSIPADSPLEVSSFHLLETPIGNLKVDTKMVDTLRKTLDINFIPKAADKKEHNLEMQFSFLSFLYPKEEEIQIVPMMLGHFTSRSDFCHWGPNYDYQFVHPSLKHESLFKSIEWLDTEAMKYLTAGDLSQWESFLGKYQSTICGRYPLALLLSIIESQNRRSPSKAETFQFQKLHYERSSNACDMSHNSVSYVAGRVVKSSPVG